jgi:uncharacterized protein (DUF1015 family)
MAELHPFRALRPVPERAAQVASVPYDVVSTEEARALADGNPLSFLRVVRPEIELEAGTDPHADVVYARARANLERALGETPFVEEAAASLYVYRLRRGAHVQTGVVGCCTVADYDTDRIRKHERTRPDKEDDRTRHILEMGCHAEPVLLAHRDHSAIDALVARETAREPLYDFTASDGVAHTLWRCADAGPLAAAFRELSLLYVADGHHRSAAASRAAAALRGRGGASDAEAGFERFLAVVFPASQLRILPYNRVVSDLGGASPADFLARLGARSALHPDAPATPARRGEFAVCLAEADGVRWYGFRLEPPAGADPIAALDVSLLQEQVLSPLLDVGDPRTSPRLGFVGGIRGTGELEQSVASGRAAAAFALYPTSLDELMAVADAGGIMPPKSTWFEPKLRSGLLVHRF